MNQTPTDLVLDASIVAMLCADTPDNDLHSALESLRVQGMRLWLYSGEIHDTLTQIQAEMQTAESTQTTTARPAHTVFPRLFAGHCLAYWCKASRQYLRPIPGQSGLDS